MMGDAYTQVVSSCLTCMSEHNEFSVSVSDKNDALIGAACIEKLRGVNLY
jgi:hypothetical protein